MIDAFGHDPWRSALFIVTMLAVLLWGGMIGTMFRRWSAPEMAFRLSVGGILLYTMPGQIKAFIADIEFDWLSFWGLVVHVAMIISLLWMKQQEYSEHKGD